MKKLFLTACLALTLGLQATANVRPVHELFPVRQSDGTTVSLYKAGDRFFSYYTTPDGHPVMRGADGTLCYAQLQDGQLTATAVVCHDAALRTAQEQAFLATSTLTAADVAAAANLQSRRNAPQRAGQTSTSDGLGKYGTSASGSVPSLGEVTIPVIMVQFTDTKFQETTTQEKLQRYFNEEGYAEDNDYERGSVRDYFVAQSFGKFQPTFDVVALVTLENSYSYYGANGSSGSGNDTKAWQMVKEAVEAAVAQGVDFSKYKLSTTGAVPNVTIYFAGPGEATGGDDNTIWPHEFDLPSLYYQFMGGTKFSSYFVGNEIYGDASSTRLMGMGVFCHEFSHALGLPDFYCTDYSYTGDNPFGNWSVMDNGAYASNSYAPSGYNAYERSFMGWLNIRELSSPETVTLADPNHEGESAVMVRNPNDKNEYFIFENRQPGTWYNSGWGSGLLVTRFCYDANAWVRNTLNNTRTLKRACVVTANGETIADGGAKPAHLYGNGTPNKETHALFNGGTLKDNEIYRVMKQPDGTLTFGFRTPNPDVTPIADGAEYQRVDDLSQLAAKDTVIIVCEQSGVALAADAQDDRIGAVLVKIEDGKAITNSSVQTLAVNYLSSSNTYTFYDRSTRSYLRLSNAGALDMYRSASANSYCRATVTIDGGNATIVFANSKASNNQLGYDADALQFAGLTSPSTNVQIYKKVAETSGIATINGDATSKTTRPGVYTLSGQYLGTTTNHLPAGLYIKDGRKVVVK